MNEDIYRDLIDFIKGLEIREARAFKWIVDNMCSDPGIVYHEISKIYSKLEWPKERSRLFIKTPELIKTVEGVKIRLPRPKPELFKKNLYEALRDRRSIRNYTRDYVDLDTLSTLLYYTVGVKGFEWGYPVRMFPSAGALQPIEVYLSIDRVSGLDKGLYHYNARDHTLTLIRSGNVNRELYEYSLHQEYVLNAAFNIVISIIYDRTFSKYGFRAYRYVLLDAGHVGMNIYLVATALGLGTVAIGAFIDDGINKVIGLSDREFAVLIYPVGVPKKLK